MDFYNVVAGGNDEGGIFFIGSFSKYGTACKEVEKICYYTGKRKDAPKIGEDIVYGNCRIFHVRLNTD